VSRYLIVNADDFGRSRGVNDGVAACHENGIVTSASLMVRWPAAREAAAYARSHPRLSVGLHVDFAEWTVREGEWRPLYERLAEDDVAAVRAEIEGQLASFRELIGRDPTHLDGHQHVQREEPARSILVGLAATLGVPLRDLSSRVRYVGSFYGQGPGGELLPEAISVEGLLGLLAGLPPGVTELGCHPALAEDVDSMYLRERLEEVRTLCDPRVREALAAAGIELFSFADLS
jgi:chitin disaccharide deacetylase